MISQKKIAEVLGMPLSTVSNILNGTPYYKKETRERVLKAAMDLGYQRNRASLAVKRGRSNLIGVVHFGSSYHTAQEAIYSLVQTISRHGYHYTVIDQRWHAGNIKEMLDELIGSRVEGVIVIGSGGFGETFTPESLERLKREGIPVVSLYGDDYSEMPLVGDGARASFYSMTRHLHSVGHRSIILPVVRGSHRSTQGRVDGFRTAMMGCGEFKIFDEDTFSKEWPRMRRTLRGEKVGVVLELEPKRYGDDVLTANYQIARRLLASGILPDALMCANDRAASGVFDALYEAGKRVPGDVAVTGADDSEVSKLLVYRLTTVRMNIARSAEATIEILMRCIRGEPLSELETFFPAQLVLRRSCGRLENGEDGGEAVVPVELPPECPKPIRKLRRRVIT